MLGISFIDLDASLADRAATIRAKHYDRAGMAVSMADCVAAATARSTGQSLATSDQALATLVQRIGGVVVPVMNSAGARPI